MENQIPQSQNSLPPKPPTNPTHWVVIGLAAVLAAGGIIYYANKPQVDDTNTLVKHQDEFKDWKTYINEDFGFELRIPSDWSVEKQESKEELFFYSQVSKDGNQALRERCKDPVIQEKEPMECSRINIDLYFYLTELEQNGTSNFEVEKINDIEWIVTQGENIGLRYTTNKKGKSYVFKVFPEDKVKLTQILSTFKFTTAVNTTDWKTYTNNEYGFEIKIPADWTTMKKNGSLAFLSDQTKQFYDKYQKECVLTNYKGENCGGEFNFVDMLFRNLDYYTAVNGQYAQPLATDKVTITNKEWLKFEAGELFGETNYQLEHGGMFYNFVIYHTGNVSEETFEKILSTFKFIESTPVTGLKYNEDFTLLLPEDWTIAATTKNSGSSLVKGDLLDKYIMSLPREYNGSVTSIAAEVHIFSDDKLAGYHYDYNWVFYDRADGKWYSMGDLYSISSTLTYKKDSPIILKATMNTSSGLPVYSEFGYGDAGCGSTHSLIHLKQLGIIVDFKYNSCYEGSMVEDLDGEEAEKIFSDFEKKWEEVIKSFELKPL